MKYEKEITDLVSRITLLENKLNDEHQLRLGLEEKLEAQNNKIENGEFESITTTTIKLKHAADKDPGIFIYSSDDRISSNGRKRFIKTILHPSSPKCL